MKRIGVLLGFALALLLMLTVSATAGDPRPKTCPDNWDGWTKIDNGDLSLYPVDGAVEYCFKAGNWDTVGSIPDGGFGQEGSCNDGIQFCDLSHWSYKLAPPPTPTNTPEYEECSEVEWLVGVEVPYTGPNGEECFTQHSVAVDKYDSEVICEVDDIDYCEPVDPTPTPPPPPPTPTPNVPDTGW